MKFQSSLGCAVHLDYEPHLKILFEHAKRQGLHSMDRIDIVAKRIERFKYVKRTCFDHCSWIQLDFETERFDVAERRLNDFKIKLERLIKSYS